MTELVKLNKIKEIHDLRQKVASARTQQSKAELARWSAATSKIDDQMAAADAASDKRIRELLSATLEPHHYQALATNIAITKLAQRDELIWLGHQRAMAQEQMQVAESELKLNQDLLSTASRKQEKFATLVAQEAQECLLREELAEENEIADTQLQKAGAANAG